MASDSQTTPATTSVAHMTRCAECGSLYEPPFQTHACQPGVARQTTDYPPWMVRLFAAGCISFVGGLILSLVAPLLGSGLAAAGSLAVVWSLMAGEEHAGIR